MRGLRFDAPVHSALERTSIQVARKRIVILRLSGENELSYVLNFR
jgi:hypothetical protein